MRAPFGILFLLASLAPAAEPEGVTPELFAPGDISQPATHEALNWISADDNQVIFTRATADFSQSGIFFGVRTENGWRQNRASYSTGQMDAGSRFAPDQSHLLFTSNRATGDTASNDTNIWRVDIAPGTPTQFVNPRPMPAPVNSSAEECCAVHASRGELLFASDRSGDWETYQAVSWGDSWMVVPLPDYFGSPRGEWPSWVNPEGTLLLMSSMRAGGQGADDVYVASRTQGQWNAPCVLPAPVNSAAYEDNPVIANERLYWSSRRNADGSASETANIFSLPLSDVEFPADLATCQ